MRWFIVHDDLKQTIIQSLMIEDKSIVDKLLKNFKNLSEIHLSFATI